MRVLGIETSCDETSAAVLRGAGDQPQIQSLVILSQDVHRIFGGVVPEIASRAHVTALVPVVERALDDARTARSDVEAIAVTHGPGLVGALLVGVSFAKALAYALAIPFIGVHHMEGHLFATSLEEPDAVPPFTALLVSGGHTLLLDVEEWGHYRLLGRTRDDAAGEAYDKVAKLLGLGYPGGPILDRLAAAASGAPAPVKFGTTKMKRNALDFSFSGLKTAVLYHVRENGEYGEEIRKREEALARGERKFEQLLPLCSPKTLGLVREFQNAVVRDLVERT
ncbi:MAG TPA: tRNA (adenosine(37)-N6)-threonylcarbamoyltransferase complex transferase subunit TsaD, partial [Gemmatimonadaceae bacterium]|nr:tRNA (adenosine(37)-N6)-threonylcarbamoyltransferase complex transferase subunit TsaD [Gemmatimonadaceae bacterium]